MRQRFAELKAAVRCRMRRFLEGLISLTLLLAVVPRRRLWCWPCMVGGSGIFFVSVTAYAQASASGPVSLDAVTFFQYVATTAAGISLAIAGWYMNRLDAKVEATSVALLRDYLSKEEVRQLIVDVMKPVLGEVRHLNESQAAMHRRLDKLHVPAAASQN
jgi:hypothetical protein